MLQIIPDDRIPGRESPEWEAYDKAREACDKAEEAWKTAWKACDKAGKPWETAWKAYVKAREACNKAWEAYLKAFGQEIEELHKELCPNCPWDGTTIFP